MGVLLFVTLFDSSKQSIDQFFLSSNLPPTSHVFADAAKIRPLSITAKQRGQKESL
jgi:hypothetical protein